MRPRTAFGLAWGACALTLALIVAIGVPSFLNPDRLGDGGFYVVGAVSAVVRRGWKI